MSQIGRKAPLWGRFWKLYNPVLETEKRLHSILICYGCHDKLPQNWWLETTEMCPLSPGVRSLESRHWQGHAFSGGSGAQSFASCRLQWLSEFFVAVSLHCLLVSYLLFFTTLVHFLLLFLIRTIVIGFNVPLIIQDDLLRF